MNVCVCCEVRLEGKGDNQSTLDHIVLRSLGGSSDMSNLNRMCRKCNQMRGNNFAEQQEFIEWYYSFDKMPARNFCYLHEKPGHKKKKTKVTRSGFLRLRSRTNNKAGQNEKSEVSLDSTKVQEVMIKGVEYVEYHHPVYGKSMVAKGTI